MSERFVRILLISLSFIDAHALYGTFYSQGGQDGFVWNYFFQKKNGVFVDIGAFDGIKFSNTKFLEEQGWTGICIEPNPDFFPQLQANRRAICVQGCISDNPGDAFFLKASGFSAMLSGMEQKYDPRQLYMLHKDVEDNHNTIEKIEVKCFQLNELLRENGIFHIDYLSIDTEGGELDILKSIDFSSFDIEMIDVENNFQEKDTETFLRKKGYILMHKIAQDDLFVKEHR